MNHGRTGTDLRIRLELLSEPSAPTLVRSVIRTIARSSELDSALLDDLSTAASEACNNVVLHAYPGTVGPLIFSLAIRSDVVEVVVRDRGCGISPASVTAASGGEHGLGMGVVLINSLADRAEFESDPLTGTEVRMTFRRPIAVPERLGELSLGVWALSGNGSSGALRARSG